MAEVHLDARLADLFTAILGHRAVGFTHGGRTRKVQPQQLAHHGGHWYLRCHDLDAGSARTYRVDRMEGAVLPLPEEAVPEGTAAGAPAGALRFRPWEFGGGEARQVEVRLDAPAAAVALAGDPDLAVARRDDEGTVVVLSVSNPDGLWPWMASFLDRAEILGPPDVREAYVDHLRRFIAPVAGAGGAR
jgi:proteasome accessory factor B